jgi:hypothetical protein
MIKHTSRNIESVGDANVISEVEICCESPSELAEFLVLSNKIYKEGLSKIPNSQTDKNEIKH